MKCAYISERKRNFVNQPISRALQFSSALRPVPHAGRYVIAHRNTQALLNTIHLQLLLNFATVSQFFHLFETPFLNAAILHVRTNTVAMIEALISLPLLSFFALPMLSSYSTSLNLLFFWMTWSTLVLSHKPLHVEIFGALIVRTIFYILPSLLFLSLDALLPSLAESMKAQGCLALPSRYGGKRMAKFVGLSLWNVILGVMVAAGLEWVAVDLLGVRSLLKVATRLPLPWHMAIDLARALAIRGVRSLFPFCSRICREGECDDKKKNRHGDGDNTQSISY